MRRCPVPGCEQAPPPRCIFCAEHYFAIPAKTTRMIHRIASECDRAEDPEIRDHLAHQLRGYISIAVKEIAKETCHA
ncbi:MAG: hypothetical protein K8H74_18045 [Notoacmeibacter sp.]|nr:hypothetical protein [Notoacmeibacter sp.]